MGKVDIVAAHDDHNDHPVINKEDDILDRIARGATKRRKGKKKNTGKSKGGKGEKGKPKNTKRGQKAKRKQKKRKRKAAKRKERGKTKATSKENVEQQLKIETEAELFSCLASMRSAIAFYKGKSRNTIAQVNRIKNKIKVGCSFRFFPIFKKNFPFRRFNNSCIQSI